MTCFTLMRLAILAGLLFSVEGALASELDRVGFMRDCVRNAEMRESLGSAGRDVPEDMDNLCDCMATRVEDADLQQHELDLFGRQLAGIVTDEDIRSYGETYEDFSAAGRDYRYQCMIEWGLADGPAADPDLQRTASSGEYMEYCARLGDDDHYNSNGVALTTVGAILRQDRANFHEFGISDPEDQYDPIFADRTSRAALERRIDASRIPASMKRAIVRGRPYVCVTIEGDTASVAIAE